MDLSMTVLIVDDFATMRRILKDNLRRMGFSKIVEAEDGCLALEELKKNEIGLIISDWNMPNMNGLELLKSVRGDEGLKHVPFIMVTAEGQKSNVVEAVQAGVTNYVVKPFPPKVLSEKLELVLSHN